MVRHSEMAAHVRAALIQDPRTARFSIEVIDETA